VAVISALVPSLAGWVIVVSAGWLGLTTGVRAFVQARRARSEERAAAIHLDRIEGGEG